MKFILFFITCFISVGALLSGLHANHVIPHFIVGWGIWYLFYLSQRGRIRRKNIRQRRAYLSEQCMRTYLRNNGHWY